MAYYCKDCTDTKTFCPRCKGFITYWILVKISIMLFTFLGVYIMMLYSFMYPPIFGTPLAFDYIYLLPIVSLIGLILVLPLLGSRRQELNNQFIAKNHIAIKRMNKENIPVPDGVKWWHNDRYEVYKKIFLCCWIVTPIVVALSIFFFTTYLNDMPLFSNILFSVIWFALPIWFTYALFIIPIDLALTNDGIRFRYRTNNPPPGISRSTKSMKWSEIEKIKVPTSDILQFIIDGLEYNVEIHDNLHDLVFRTYRLHQKRKKASFEKFIARKKKPVIATK
jgi:hypothetical protein